MLWKTGYSLWPQANDDLCQREPRSQTNTNTYENPNELLKLSCKITGVTKETLVSSHSTILSFSEKMAKFVSFLVESVDQISTKPIAFQRNMPRKLPWNQPFFTDHFQRNLPWEFLWISCEISYFSVNLTFFHDLQYQKPC